MYSFCRSRSGPHGTTAARLLYVPCSGVKYNFNTLLRLLLSYTSSRHTNFIIWVPIDSLLFCECLCLLHYPRWRLYIKSHWWKHESYKLVLLRERHENKLTTILYFLNLYVLFKKLYYTQNIYFYKNTNFTHFFVYMIFFKVFGFVDVNYNLKCDITLEDNIYFLYVDIFKFWFDQYFKRCTFFFCLE